MKFGSKLAIASFGLMMSMSAFSDVINLTDGGSITLGDTTVTWNSTAQERTYCRCDQAAAVINCLYHGWLSDYRTYDLNVVSGTSGKVLFTAKKINKCEDQPPKESCEAELLTNPACR